MRVLGGLMGWWRGEFEKGGDVERGCNLGARIKEGGLGVLRICG